MSNTFAVILAFGELLAGKRISDSAVFHEFCAYMPSEWWLVRVFKVLLFYPDDGQVYKCDAIDYQNGIWLVPDWSIDHVSGVAKPTRIIRIDGLVLCESTFPGCRSLLVPGQLSEGVPKGDIEPRPPIEVVHSPDIEIHFNDAAALCHRTGDSKAVSAAFQTR